MNIIAFTQPEITNFLVRIINGLVSATNVAMGVVLFTLILKAITLPFDFISRSSMRKNSLKMEEMRPELEKLQKQYADNKELYNQKMMALYKKNGYSMFGACLPTIITLVIFIVAINAFTSFSKYQNTKYFYDMSVAYDNVVYAGMDLDGEYISRDETGKLVFDNEKIVALGNGEHPILDKNFSIFLTITDNGYNAQAGGDEHYYTLYTTNSYVEYTKFYYTFSDGRTEYAVANYAVRTEGLKTPTLASEENNFLKTEAGQTFLDSGLTMQEFITDIQGTMAAETFRNNGSKFLWVKNIWMQDSPMAHPVDYSVFGQNQSSCSACDCSCTGEYDVVDEANMFAPLTAKLTEEKESANGYFILIILTAASSLITQLVMSKSQKAQMELQTVDGQGAQQQKMMTYMMPIMMAIFSFMYTAAFSIYIILNSIMSILTTLGINFLVDKKYKKVTASSGPEKVRSISKEKPQPKKEEKDKPKKKKEKAVPDNDFLSGKANKNHIRGRLK